MFCLADTHIALWLIDDSPKMPEAARALLRDPENQWFLSYASVWEVALKHAKFPDRMPLSAKLFHDDCITAGFYDLPLSLDHFYRTELLPMEDVHGDPFDRMLLAQAHYEDLVLVSHDQSFASYKNRHVLLV